MDYKETIFLPKTTFPMRGNLPQNEPKRYKSWFERDLYTQMKSNRQDRELFTLHDGPPYANGHIHIGHALNKVLKDIIVKYNYFQGKDVRFTAGWDCHGLPIEQQVEKKIGTAKKEILPKTKIRELCREHAAKFVGIQKEAFKSLGVVADWENPYLTMDFKFEANIYRTLCAIAQKGILVQRSKPVYWSCGAKSALAEAEVEYEDKVSPSIYVAFALSKEASEVVGAEASIIIWTTTPWTLPANTGISLNPEVRYILSADGYIVAADLYPKLKELGVVKGEIVREIDPKTLERKEAINPLNSRASTIVLGEHVTTDSGTGAVHTAPGHGEDDYRVGLIYDLEVIMPVDEDGAYDESIVRDGLFPKEVVQEFVGVNIHKANERILELLGAALLRRDDITHSYPHCWRTKTPLMFRATKQWFIAVDEGEKSLREVAMSEIDNTAFYPDRGRNRIGSMVEGRPDWCISRQRDWGVPIAFFINKSNDKPLLDEKVLNYIAMIFDKFGCDAWYDMSVEELLHPAYQHLAPHLEKVHDILDVWFDSGSTWDAVLNSGNYDAGAYPASLYLEGSDQHRGWFQSSLLISSAVNEHAPFKAVLTHGFTLDKNGEKMSKSIGNVIAPDQVIKQYGSEILRLWVAMSDYQNDIKIGDDILKQVAEQYRKLRNTFRFLLANINDLDECVKVHKVGILDRWILNKARTVFNEVNRLFSIYEFSKGFHMLNSFVVNELSGIYLDVCKDRLYCDSKNDIHRLASQTTMAMITESLLGLIAPVLTYTADEIIEHAPSVLKGDKQSIFDLEYVPLPEVEMDLDEAFCLEAREKFFEEVDKLKKEKKIKNTLELVLYTDAKAIMDMNSIEAEDLFLVSGVHGIVCGIDEPLVSFRVENERFIIAKSVKEKCPRCWKFNATEELCPRCHEVLHG